MMDGICFRSGDTLYPISASISAGEAAPQYWPPGHVCEIMTGAPVPTECDCLVPYEEFSVGVGSSNFIFNHPPSNKFIHETGADIQAGQTAVEEGALIGPIELAIAATFGYERLLVRSRARVMLITTGDEVVPISHVPDQWQIRLSHAEMLRHGILAKSSEFTHQHVKDDQKFIRTKLEQCIPNCDLLLITGGISRGKKDFIKEAVHQLYGPPDFHGVSQRPGKPMAFWRGSPCIMALPGNPLSVFATFCRYVVPFLEMLEGRPLSSYVAALSHQIRPHESLELLLPVRKNADGSIKAMNFTNSGNILACNAAFGIAAVPRHGCDSSEVFSIYPYFSKS